MLLAITLQNVSSYSYWFYYDIINSQTMRNTYSRLTQIGWLSVRWGKFLTVYRLVTVRFEEGSLKTEPYGEKSLIWEKTVHSWDSLKCSKGY